MSRRAATGDNSAGNNAGNGESEFASEFATDTGSIYYEILGTDTFDPETPDAAANAPAKPWITLLHNFMSTGRTAWGTIAAKLTDDYRVLLPDLPGHGRSVGHPADFAYRAIACQLADLMAHVGAGQGHLAGVSAGGMLAQWLVHEGWASPASLMLVSTTHSMNPATAGAPVTTDPDRFRFGKNWLDATAALHDKYQGDGYFRREILPATGDRAPELTLDLPLDALANWSMPVCIIHGAEDEFFPVAIARKMAAHLPAARLHVIPDQSHALIFRQSWKVADLLREFLAES
ncbi:MAG: alpha/beta fold hydrolase [Litorilinea sp.]